MNEMIRRLFGASTSTKIIKHIENHPSLPTTTWTLSTTTTPHQTQKDAELLSKLIDMHFKNSNKRLIIK